MAHKNLGVILVAVLRELDGAKKLMARLQPYEREVNKVIGLRDCLSEAAGHWYELSRLISKARDLASTARR